MPKQNLLATDLGASSGRVMLGRFDGQQIEVEELHRFSNDPVVLGGAMYWDFLRLFHEIKQGLLCAKPHGGAHSISVDTWGVDFGLLDRTGRLLGNPVHYRDARTAGILEKALCRIDREELYQRTGNQIMEINTVFQLLAMQMQQPSVLELAEDLLMMPDLFHYFLSGEKSCECSIASTTQLMDAYSKTWSAPIFNALELPIRLMQPVVPSGTRLGRLSAGLCNELGIASMEVTASAGHDTQCALAAVPAEEQDFIFISCGTWSLFGTELDAPLVNAKSASYNLTNECGYGGKTSFLKNIIGLWLVQESRRQWIREGTQYSFGQLEAMANQEQQFQRFIDPDAPEFVPSGDVPERIRAYCRQTGQPEPESAGAIIRCINESLAFTYRSVLEEIRQCTGKRYDAIYMVGGGTKSSMLCQMTANACGCPVYAGPAEATVFGNLALQLIAAGELSGLDEARAVIRRSARPTCYLPENTHSWDTAYETYLSKTRK